MQNEAPLVTQQDIWVQLWQGVCSHIPFLSRINSKECILVESCPGAGYQCWSGTRQECAWERREGRAFVGQVPDPEFKNPRWNENYPQKKAGCWYSREVRKALTQQGYPEQGIRTQVREEGISQLEGGYTYRKDGMDEFIGDNGCQDAGCQRRWQEWKGRKLERTLWYGSRLESQQECRNEYRNQHVHITCIVSSCLYHWESLRIHITQ